MKMHLLRIGVIALLAVAGSNAQSPSTFNIDVPFDFVVNGKTLAAGPYSVAPAASGTLIIRSSEGKGGVVLFTTPVDSARAGTDAKLVFNRYGNMYFLSQVWKAGTKTGGSVPTTRQERELMVRESANRNATIIAAR